MMSIFRRKPMTGEDLIQQLKSFYESARKTFKEFEDRFDVLAEIAKQAEKDSAEFRCQSCKGIPGLAPLRTALSRGDDQRQIAELKRELTKRNAEITELKHKMSQKDALMDRKEEELRCMRSEISKEADRVRVLDTKTKELTTENSRLKDRSKEMEETISCTRNENKRLHQENQQLLQKLRKRIVVNTHTTLNATLSSQAVGELMNNLSTHLQKDDVDLDQRKYVSGTECAGPVVAICINFSSLRVDVQELLKNIKKARTSDIVQIAASTNEEEINIYMTPSKPISIGASEATGLTCVGGELKYNGVVVESEMPKSGLRKFVTFIRDHPQSILVGHNIQNFDVPILTYQLAKHGLKEEFSESIIGYMGTLKIAKKTWKKQDVENYKQENLVKKFLVDYEYPAHNALADVKALKKLFEEQMAESVSHKDIFTNSYYSCKASLEPLQTANALSGNMSRKLVECSLSLAKLKAIHKRDPQNGIRNILSESAVTKCKTVISKITNYLDTCI